MKFDARANLLLILIALAVTGIFTKLGLGYLPSYDDGYYAQKAREILARGDWITMHHGVRTEFDNPPGFMWLIALSYKVFGVSEFSARFPSALAGVLGILGTFYLFEVLFNTRLGFLAALVLALTSLYLKYARHAMMDVSCAATLAWASYAFVRAIKGRSSWFMLAGLIGGYVPFAKSVFGVVPPIVFVAYLVATREWRQFKTPALWAGLALYLAPYAGWCAAEYARFGRPFLEAHFVSLLFGMSQRGGADDHHYDYVLVLLKYFPVFLPFMLYGIWTALRARGVDWRAHAFGLLYFAIFFFMLSAQGTTKTWYFISALPGCAGLAAVGLDRATRRWSLATIARATAGLTFAAFIVIEGTPITLGVDRAVDTKRLAPFVRAAAEQGFTLASYQTDYYGLNSSLLFYSDHDAPSVDDGALRQMMSAPGGVAVIFDSGDWARLAATLPELRVIRASPKLTLVANRALDQERVF